MYFNSNHLISSFLVSEGPGKGQVQHDFGEKDKDESEEVKERQTGEPPNLPSQFPNGLHGSLCFALILQRDKNRAELLEFLNSTL